MGVGSLEFFDFDGLDEDVFILFGSEFLEDFVVELVFHELVFVLEFHGEFMLFKL